MEGGTAYHEHDKVIGHSSIKELILIHMSGVFPDRDAIDFGLVEFVDDR